MREPKTLSHIPGRGSASTAALLTFVSFVAIQFASDELRASSVLGQALTGSTQKLCLTPQRLM